MQHTPGKISSAAKAGLTIGALGVVFGDIGTSPLYALRECLHAIPEADRAHGILGALSLVFWALVIIVCIKYLLFVEDRENQHILFRDAISDWNEQNKTAQLLSFTQIMALAKIANAQITLDPATWNPFFHYKEENETFLDEPSII